MAEASEADRLQNRSDETQGTGMGCERERYSWDAASGIVTIDTLESNLRGPGSGWRYELVSAAEAPTCASRLLGCRTRSRGS
jgi:hypothetical protein